MRILHTIAPGEFGGLEEVVLRLSSGLRDRGHDVQVAVTLTSDADDHPFLRELEAEGTKAHSIRVGSRGYLSELTRVRTLARAFAPHVLHTHGYRPGVLHPRAVRALETHLVTTLHGFTGGGLKNRLYESIQLWSARRYDAVVAVSSTMVTRLHAAGIHPQRTHVISNAWRARHELDRAEDARAALGVPSGRFHIGWVGRLSYEKGPDVLLEACRYLGNLEMTVSFIGDGRLGPDLRTAVAAQPNADVRFHGSLASAARLFSAFDAFVLSSRTEGTPIALFEAMEAGVPVVATSVGGVPDVIDESTAILVASESPVALADGIRAVHDHPEAARERAVLARRRLIEAYAVEPWIERHEALYSSLEAKE
jgi:glycosyltransferase involved in cell wall biosynthesis